MDIQTNTQYAPRAASSDEISPRQVLRILWARRWLLLPLWLAVVVAAAAAQIVLPSKYVATVLLSPRSDSLSSSQLSPLGQSLQQFGSLASLAGFSLPTDSRRAESIAMLTSHVLTEEYIRDNDLLPVLFATKWDAGLRRWKGPPAEVPTLWQATRKFSGIRTVSTEAGTGLVKVTIKWTDPVLAARWANGLVQLTNDYLRRQAIALSDRNIAFLNDQAAKTSIVETRQAIALLLQSEINKEMLAKGSQEYAFKILDPAEPPQRPSSTRLILLMLGVACVVLGSALIALFVGEQSSA